MKGSKYGCKSTGLRRFLAFAELYLIKTTTTTTNSELTGITLQSDAISCQFAGYSLACGIAQ